MRYKQRCVCARYSSGVQQYRLVSKKPWVCAGRNGSFEATIAPSARWGESSLANAHAAERTTGGAASRIRVRNFDDGELLSCGSFVHQSTRLFHPINDCHEGSGSETTVESTSDIVPQDWTIFMNTGRTQDRFDTITVWQCIMRIPFTILDSGLLSGLHALLLLRRPTACFPVKQ
jgi:hypothetical protein